MNTSYCLTDSFNTQIVKLDAFEIGKSSRLLCYYTPINESFIEIIWKYNNERIYLINENFVLLDNDKILYFKSFNQQNFGNYTCEVFVNGQSFISSLSRKYLISK